MERRAGLLPALVFAAAGHLSPAAEQPAVPPGTRAECARPTGPSLRAAEILDQIRSGQDVVLAGRIIEGSLESGPASAPGAAAAGPGPEGRADRLVPGRLALTGCMIAGRISFPRAVFAQGLDLRCTEISGDLDLAGAIVRGGLGLADARVSGPVRLGGLHASGDVVLDRARLLDQLDLSRAEIAGRLSLAKAQLPRGLDAAGILTGSLELPWADLGGPLSVSDGLVLGDFWAVDADLRRGVSILNTRIQGKLDLRESRITGGAQLEGVRIATDLLAGVESLDSLDIRGCEVARRLSLFDARLGPLRVSDLRVIGSAEWDDARFNGDVRIERSRLGKEFSADGAVFAGRCEFRSVLFPGDEPFEGAEFKTPATLVDTPMAIPPRARVESEEPDDWSEDQADADDD